MCSIKKLEFNFWIQVKLSAIPNQEFSCFLNLFLLKSVSINEYIKTKTMYKMKENEANHVLLPLSGRQLLISDTLHSNESSNGIRVTARMANMPH